MSKMIPAAVVILLCVLCVMAVETSPATNRHDYLHYVTNCLETLMTHGTDRYGPKHAPILVSILDVETRQCPSNPAALDEPWRVIRRDRRNPAGANLLTDQPTLKAFFAASQITGTSKYAGFANMYIDWYMNNLVDEKGFFWWGWHRHYDVFQDRMLGHQGNPHEIHAIHCIAWDRLWQVNPTAVRREIEAIWQWHVIDKTTGEINRHGDGQRGCDFAMSAGACAYAFAFLHSRTREGVWLDRAKKLARYYWERRDPKTALFADRPNAGSTRFDGAHFVTADTGLHCHALLKCHELTGDPLFEECALAYLRAYRTFGYDAATGKFWGSLKLDGTPVPGPRLMPSAGYGVYEPRGHLDLWQPYAAGYEHPLPSAQAYAFAADRTGDPVLLDSARRFADLVAANLPPRACLDQCWYQGYARQYAPEGTYAGLYGQTVSFFVHLHILSGEQRYLDLARATAADAVARLYHNGLFRGHPAKPYYEAMDGVGYLLYALLQLDQVGKRPHEVLAGKRILIGTGHDRVPLALDNW